MTYCISCGKATIEWSIADSFLGNPLRLCLNCQHVELEETPSEDAINNFYRVGYSIQRNAYMGEAYAILMRKRAAAQIAFIKQFAPLKGIRVCDVGCGYGFFMEAIKSYTPHVHGVEYDPASVAFCTGKGLHVELLENEEELLHLPKSDLFVLSHCLEHLARPAESLVALGKRANMLFLEVPAYNPAVPEQFADQEGHLNFFNHRSLNLFLERNGFDIVSLSSCGPGIRFFYSPIWKIARKICQTVTRDFFMNRYGTEHPEGIWLRMLIRRKVNL